MGSLPRNYSTAKREEAKRIGAEGVPTITGIAGASGLLALERGFFGSQDVGGIVSGDH